MINSTINTYNLYSTIYDVEVIEFWQNFPLTIINQFKVNLFGKKILNLGSGPGRDAILLRNIGLDVTCLDASEKMIEKTQILGFKSIKVDFSKMDFENKSFDGVWAFTSLLHIKKSEVKLVLDKIHHLLTDDGIFLIGMIEGTYEGNKTRDSMPNTYRYFKYYQEQELKTLVTSAGFEFIWQERYKPYNNIYISQIYKKSCIKTKLIPSNP